MTYTALFEPSSFSGPNGSTASATYDSWGRVTSSQTVDGAYTSYTYSGAGVVPQTQLAVTKPDPGGQSDNSPMTTMYRWQLTTLDGVGRPAKVQSGTGQTPGTVVSETDTVYGPCACSPMGKMKQVSQPYAPGNTVYWTTYNYDAIGRTVSVVAAENSTTSYVYQGNVTTVTDPAGKWKTTTTDVQGNTTQVYEPDPSGQASGLYTYYTYDTMEHLTQVSMPRGSVTQTRTFTYSPSTHLLTSETHPETGTTSYTYTADNFTSDLLTSKTDAKGQVTKYSYDSYYRVTEIQRYPNGLAYGEDVCQRVAYNYDSYTDPATNQSFGAWGQVAMIATGSPSGCAVPGYAAQQFEQLFNYNSTGRVITKRLEMLQPNTSAQVWDVYYTYNQLGQQVSITYPANGAYPGIKYTTGYDSVDRPVTLTDSTRNITVVQNVTYNAANQPLQTTFQYPYASTFTETRTYNQLNELIGITNFGGSVNLAYNFTGGQNNGQIASSVDAGTSTYYTYDGLKRLYSATSGAWSQTYNYDGFGNMYSKSGSGATFTSSIDQTTNRLSGGNYCYDANGNMISDQNGGGCGNPNYTYDAANRLVSAKVSGGTEYYWYSADNKRIAKFGANGFESIYIYGANGEKLVAAGANNLYFAGRLIKQNTDTVYASADNNFVAVDRMGSVKAAITNNGTSPASTSFLPYGEELSATANDLIKFATYTRDGSTGLDYADQRYYTSQFGRFMSADRSKRAAKANDSGSWNKYSYSGNDPVNRLDKHGREECYTDDEEECDCDDGDYCDDDDDGGGGGGGAVQNKGGVGTDPSKAARTAWQYLNSNWIRCLNDFAQDGRFNAAQFQTLLTASPQNGGINWINASDPSVSSHTVDYYAHNGDMTLISYYLSGGADAYSVLSANIVFLGSDFYTNETQTQQIAVEIHEALHIELGSSVGADDNSLAGWLMNFGFTPGSNSGQITNWIVGTANQMDTNGGCLNPPKQ